MLETVYHAYVETSDPIARKHLARAVRRLVMVETLRDLPHRYGRRRYSASVLTPEEVELGVNQGKIACIKAHRTRTNYGLKDSKDACEAYFARNSLAFKGYDVYGKSLTPSPWG